MATNFLEQATYLTLAKPGKHADGEGLYLDVRSASSASWLFMFTYGGKRDEVGLGSRKKITLTKARELRAWCIAELAAGHNPRLSLKAQKDALALAVAAPKAATVYELARDNIAVIAKRAKSQVQRDAWVRSLQEDYIGVIANMAPCDVKLHHVKPMLARHYAERPEVAKDIRQRLAKLLGWAMRHDENWSNPCAWTDNLEHEIEVLDREVVHLKSMAFDKVGALVARVRGHNKACDGIKLGLLWGIASVTRVGETIGCDWSEFDWQADCWVIPAARMKMGKPHRVPLTAFHHQILDALLGDNPPPKSGPVFTSRPGVQVSDHGLRRLLGVLTTDKETLHGFRSTFADWARSQMGWAKFEDGSTKQLRLYDDEMVEEALSHVIGSKVRQAYVRSDFMEQRRPMLEAWGAYLNVVQEDVIDMLARRRRKLAA